MLSESRYLRSQYGPKLLMFIDGKPYAVTGSVPPIPKLAKTMYLYKVSAFTSPRAGTPAS